MPGRMAVGARAGLRVRAGSRARAGLRARAGSRARAGFAGAAGNGGAGGVAGAAGMAARGRAAARAQAGSGGGGGAGGASGMDGSAGAGGNDGAAGSDGGDASVTNDGGDGAAEAGDGSAIDGPIDGRGLDATSDGRDRRRGGGLARRRESRRTDGGCFARRARGRRGARFWFDRRRWVRLRDTWFALVCSVGRSIASRGARSGGRTAATMQRARRLLIAAIVALGTWSRAAMAHPTGLSQGEYAYEEGKVFAGITFARRELARPFRGCEVTTGSSPSSGSASPLGRWVLDHLTVAADDAPCAGAFDGMRFDGDGVALALSYACPKGARLDIDARFASDLERGHRHIVALTAGDERREAVATETRTRVSFAVGGGEPSPTQSPAQGVFASLARMGIEHILTGYDHFSFWWGWCSSGGPYDR